MPKSTTATPTPAARVRNLEARLLTPANRKALARAGVAGQTPENVLSDIVVNLDAALPPEWDSHVKSTAIPEENSVWLFRLGCSRVARRATVAQILDAATSPEAVAEIEASPEWRRLTRKTA